MAGDYAQALVAMVPWFVNHMEPADALTWGLSFQRQLVRAVPLAVIHDWQANVVGPLAAEVAKPKRPHRVLARMHADTLAGARFRHGDWMPVLKAAFLAVSMPGYVYAEPNADADADALAYCYEFDDPKAYAKNHFVVTAYVHAFIGGSDAKRLAVGLVECLARAGG